MSAAWPSAQHRASSPGDCASAAKTRRRRPQLGRRHAKRVDASTRSPTGGGRGRCRKAAMHHAQNSSRSSSCEASTSKSARARQAASADPTAPHQPRASQTRCNSRTSIHRVASTSKTSNSAKNTSSKTSIATCGTSDAAGTWRPRTSARTAADGERPRLANSSPRAPWRSAGAARPNLSAAEAQASWTLAAARDASAPAAVRATRANLTTAAALPGGAWETASSSQPRLFEAIRSRSSATVRS
mmetsp:Transcript_26971/g.96299  ORF Transcript_26971/g.96299 Transcript_26971/m.96299 type:complete len:244 (+) Transcript_26971:1670-2401(+)